MFLLDGLRKGGAGCISATCIVAAGPIRKVFDNWQTNEADDLQASISAVRKTIQSYPMIPALKAIMAHFRDDPEWAKLRPPFTELPGTEADKLIGELKSKYNFHLDFDDEEKTTERRLSSCATPRLLSSRTVQSTDPGPRCHGPNLCPRIPALRADALRPG